MRSLTLRIFVSFWLIIVALVGLAAVAGYAYSERLREAYTNFDNGDVIVEASAALEAGGREQLVDWLRDFQSTAPLNVFVVDMDGHDLLGRRLPSSVQRALQRFGRSHRRSRNNAWSWRDDDRPNLRRARPITRLLGRQGNAFSVFVVPKRTPYREWIAERAAPTFLLLALAISGAVSFALASAITQPVKRFREATLAIADGKFGTRVAPSVRQRHDEIGLLAQDLDAMAQKLERASELQTELTRNVSHELRSPLARLRVALELARRRAGDLDELSRIETETERLDGLIGQLLSFSRLTGDDTEPLSDIDVQALLEEAVANANFECRSLDIDNVAVRLDSQPVGRLHGYTGALTSAFDNVLRNAIRHSPANSTVGVRLFPHGDDVCVHIDDDGDGVPPADLERIFEPFFRSAAGGEPMPTGTGLGLAIAKRAIDKHGGTVVAQTLDPGGLRIAMRLPRRAAAPA